MPGTWSDVGDHSDHSHDHHAHSHGCRFSVRSLFGSHSHDAKDSLDQALEGSRQGVRTVAWSLAVLLATAVIQALVVVASGSVALLGDTLHNAADGLTAVPLWLAFSVGRRPATARFTYGFGKAEDLAGLAVVGIIAVSAGIAMYESVERFIHPEKVTHLPIVMAAAIVGVVGNEVVAQYRIRVGRRIGSAALEADGLHARVDGVTSLLVLLGAMGVILGLPWADAVVGLLIALAILVVFVQTARSVAHRMLDAIDPSIVASMTAIVAAVSEIRARWAGHRLLAQIRLTVDGRLSVIDAHEVAERAYHELLHKVPNLSDAIVHVDPKI